MKPKHSKLRLLRQFLRGSIPLFLLSIFAAFVVTFFEMVNPQIIRYTLDSVLGTEPSSLPELANRMIGSFGGREFLRTHLWILGLAVAAVAAFSAVFRFINTLFNTKAAETLTKRMRDLLFSHIQRLPFSWHMENQTGDMIQRCTSDVDVIRDFISEQLTSVFRIVLLLVLSLTFMFSMNLKLSFVAVVSFPLIIAFSAFFQGKISKYFTKCDENEGVLSTIAQENLTGVRVVRAFGRESFEKEKFEKQNLIYTNAWMKVCAWMTYFWATSDFISAAQVMLIITVGAVICVRGDMTSGELVAFIAYNAMLVWPVRRLGRLIADMSKSGVSLTRIAYIMDSEPESDAPGAVAPKIKGEIEFRDVSFSYNNERSSGIILDHISFKIRKGQTFGILGATGSGKSTLVHLLDRLYPVTEGEITVDGVDISNIQTDHLRRNIGIVLQEPFLFSGTIRENIGITSDALTQEEIREAASIACVDDTIESFEKGYETIVGERGVTLSGGQKQRVAIARMLTQKTPIMIFDDSLSAVDAQTDAMIRRALKSRLADATVIIISHRISTLMDCDQIIVLEDGKIAEQGTHEELIAKGGIYGEIYELQTGSGEEAAQDE